MSGWNVGAPVLVLGSRNVRFTGEDGKEIAYSNVELLDGNPPEKGEGLRVLSAKCDSLNVKPGWYFGQITVTGNQKTGSVKTSLTLNGWLGDAPALVPPGAVADASTPVSAAATPAVSEGRNGRQTAAASA